MFSESEVFFQTLVKECFGSVAKIAFSLSHKKFQPAECLFEVNFRNIYSDFVWRRFQEILTKNLDTFIKTGFYVSIRFFLETYIFCDKNLFIILFWNMGVFFSDFWQLFFFRVTKTAIYVSRRNWWWEYKDFLKINVWFNNIELKFDRETFRFFWLETLFRVIKIAFIESERNFGNFLKIFLKTFSRNKSRMTRDVWWKYFGLFVELNSRCLLKVFGQHKVLKKKLIVCLFCKFEMKIVRNFIKKTS